MQSYRIFSRRRGVIKWRAKDACLYMQEHLSVNLNVQVQLVERAQALRPISNKRWRDAIGHFSKHL